MNKKKPGVSESVAGELHELTVQLLIMQIRQMSMTGEFDNAAVRNALVYLKQNDITVDAEVDQSTISLLGALKELDLSNL